VAVKLVTDSTSYIDEKTRRELDIKRVNLSVHFPDESFDETEVAYEYFYDKINREGVIPTSSQPSLGMIYETFKEIVARGEEVLGIFISAKMSGTYDTALHAKQMLMNEYPQACIEIVDSTTNCMALGLQVIEAAMAANLGQKMEEVIEIAQQTKKRMKFLFVPASLDYLIKGGRIGGASALIGSLLQIRPILYVNDGMTDVFDRVRGTKAALKRMIDIVNEDARKLGLKHLVVHDISAPQRGNEVAAKLSDKHGRKVSVYPLGPVIGLHVGPGTIGIVYCTET